jgi:hypothetical protein
VGPLGVWYGARGADRRRGVRATFHPCCGFGARCARSPQSLTLLFVHRSGWQSLLSRCTGARTTADCDTPLPLPLPQPTCAAERRFLSGGCPASAAGTVLTGRSCQAEESPQCRLTLMMGTSCHTTGIGYDCGQKLFGDSSLTPFHFGQVPSRTGQVVFVLVSLAPSYWLAHWQLQRTCPRSLVSLNLARPLQNGARRIHTIHGMPYHM